MPEKLAENEDAARLSYALATIKTDVDIGVELSELKQNQIDFALNLNDSAYKNKQKRQLTL